MERHDTVVGRLVKTGDYLGLRPPYVSVAMLADGLHECDVLSHIRREFSESDPISLDTELA